MPVIIRAAINLLPGAKLYYDCPLMGGSIGMNRFVDAHRSKTATFIGYCETLVGPLDYRGRMPGRYINPGVINVRFESEEPRDLNSAHFVLRNTANATLAAADAREERLGDLPDPVCFYPGDTVHIKKHPEGLAIDGIHEIGAVFVGHPQLAPGTVPRYWVLETEAEQAERVARFKRQHAGALAISTELSIRKRAGWNLPVDALELVESGNVFALYTAPELFSFVSDAEEAAFWAMGGISHRVARGELPASLIVRNMNYVLGTNLHDTYELFESGVADCITPRDTTISREQSEAYFAWRLCDCFAAHRPRVRELTMRLWREHAR